MGTTTSIARTSPLGAGALTGPTAASWPRPARGTAARGPAAPSWPGRSRGRTGRSPVRPRCPARPRCTGSSGCRSAVRRQDRVRGAGEVTPPTPTPPPQQPPALYRGGAEAGHGGAGGQRAASGRVAILRGHPARAHLIHLGGPQALEMQRKEGSAPPPLDPHPQCRLLRAPSSQQVPGTWAQPMPCWLCMSHTALYSPLQPSQLPPAPLTLYSPI